MLEKYVNSNTSSHYLPSKEFTELYKEYFEIVPKYCKPCTDSLAEGFEIGIFHIVNPSNNKMITINKI